MRATRTRLTTRIVVAFGLFGSLLALAMAVLVMVAWEYTEQEHLHRLASSEMQYLRDSGEPHSAVAGDLALYQGPAAELRAQLAPELAGLSAGSHWLSSPARLVQVEEQAGMLRVISIELEDIETREHRLTWILLGCVLLAAYASIWAGFWLSRRIAEPVRTLAGSVSRQQLDIDQPLAPGYADDEVGALAQAFDDYQARIRTLIERERRFTDQASHELRTPITVISGAAELLLEDPSLAPAAKRRVERVRRAALEMAELVETFLLLARDDGEIEPPGAPTPSVAAVARRAMDSQRVWLEDKPVQLRLEVDQDLPCPAPDRLLAIVLANLVRNACQVTERGRVELRVRATGVDVSDTGPGMSAEMRARALLARDRRTAPGSGRTGLGLPLVGALCERQGWSVGFVEREGGGTVAELRFAPASSRELDKPLTGT